jgi:hypothetical protein
MAKVEIEEDELRKYREVFKAIRLCLSNPAARTKIIEAQAILADAMMGSEEPRPADALAIVRQMVKEGY